MLQIKNVSKTFNTGTINEKKALKGPSEFNSVLIVGEKASAAGLKGQFNANIGNSITSIFYYYRR